MSLGQRKICKGTRPEGFTLIELLVVIAIIGILSSVVLASVNTARTKANDARRLSDVHQIGLAISQVADDNGGTYPSSGGVGACLGTSGSCWGSVFSGNAALNTALQKYISSIPVDPTRTSGIGDRYVYVDAAGIVAWHCSNPPNGYSATSYPTGPFIAWMPSAGAPATDAACKNTTFYGCCMSGASCADGFSCIYQIPK